MRPSGELVRCLADRAVFHFLIAAADRRSYVGQVRRLLRPGGHVLVATFAQDGPTRCSELEVARYTPDPLHGEFSPGGSSCFPAHRPTAQSRRLSAGHHVKAVAEVHGDRLEFAGRDPGAMFRLVLRRGQAVVKVNSIP